MLNFDKHTITTFQQFYMYGQSQALWPPLCKECPGDEAYITQTTTSLSKDNKMQEKEEELTNLLFHASIGFGLPVGL